MIDTKKAREMRAKGTEGKWASDVDDGRPDDVILDAKGHRLAVVRASHHIDDESNFHNAKLIAYAVNALDEWPNEIDRLRDMLDDARICFVPDTQMTEQQVKIRDRVEFAVGATTRDPDVVRPPPEPER